MRYRMSLPNGVNITNMINSQIRRNHGARQTRKNVFGGPCNRTTERTGYENAKSGKHGMFDDYFDRYE